MIPCSQIRNSIAGCDDVVLITGASGFIGTRLVENLLARGCRHVRCFIRSGKSSFLDQINISDGRGRVEIVKGNLLNMDDCVAATKNAVAVFHLAAGRGEKSVPDAYMNSVVTTRNLLEATRRWGTIRRFVNVSSFAVYANTNKTSWRTLDESCPVEAHPELAGDAYCFAKAKQDDMVKEYGLRSGIPYVMVRPGYVFGPGKSAISGRVGIGSFGIFLHFGGSNRIPLTYVDNCADALAVIGLSSGVEGQVFNVVDDDLPTSRQFLRLYKRNVREFSSLYLPHSVSYAFCRLWESYSRWSHEQLPPAFNRKKWHTYWKKTFYSNEKLKSLGWSPQIPMTEALSFCLESWRKETANA